MHQAPGIMLPPLSFEKAKYVVSIRESHEGFAVYVEEEMPPKKTMSMAEMEKNLGGIVKTVQNTYDQNELAEIQRKNNEKAEQEKMKIDLGLHTFQTFNEMTAFLSFVYAFRIEADEQKKKQTA